MKIERIPGVEIIMGSKSKIEYFEVFGYEQNTENEILLELKEYCKSKLDIDSIHKYDEYQCYFYKHKLFANYSSFAGENTSNFEEGGIRDWDNPMFYNMGKKLISKVLFNGNNANYIIYKNGDIILDKMDNNEK